MLEFITSFYFLILWGLSLSVLILLAIILIYKKELVLILNNILEYIKNNTYDKILLQMKEDKSEISGTLILIQTEQNKIYKKLEEHDERLTSYEKEINVSSLGIDIEELSTDIANTLSHKIREKKVDKLERKPNYE